MEEVKKKNLDTKNTFRWRKVCKYLYYALWEYFVSFRLVFCCCCFALFYNDVAEGQEAQRRTALMTIRIRVDMKNIHINFVEEKYRNFFSFFFHACYAYAAAALLARFISFSGIFFITFNICPFFRLFRWYQAMESAHIQKKKNSSFFFSS